MAVVPASLQNRDLSHPLVAYLFCPLHGLLPGGTSVVCVWFPSRVVLAGNSAVDIAA